MNSEVTLEQLRGMMQVADSAVEVSNKTGDEFVSVYELRQFDRFSGKYVRQLLTTPPASGEVVGVQEVSNLLAVIHGDGGHYQHDHGTAKAATDALAKYTAIQQRMAEAAPKQAMGWLPIEGCPEATPVLVVSQDGIVQHAVVERYGENWFVAWEDEPLPGLKPTRYMELPSPPEKAGG